MSFNLHIPTSLDEVKHLAADAATAVTAKAAEYEHKAIDVAEQAKAKAANAVQGVVDQIPTVTITKKGE